MAAEIAISIINDYLTHSQGLIGIIFVANDDGNFELYKEELNKIKKKK